MAVKKPCPLSSGCLFSKNTNQISPQLQPEWANLLHTRNKRNLIKPWCRIWGLTSVRAWSLLWSLSCLSGPTHVASQLGWESLGQENRWPYLFSNLRGLINATNQSCSSCKIMSRVRLLHQLPPSLHVQHWNKWGCRWVQVLSVCRCTVKEEPAKEQADACQLAPHDSMLKWMEVEVQLLCTAVLLLCKREKPLF